MPREILFGKGHKPNPKERFPQRPLGKPQGVPPVPKPEVEKKHIKTNGRGKK